MPTYEYACTSCGEHTEVVQSFADEPLTECPLCGGPLRKVFGSIGIVLKGSGFYKTDSRTSSGPKATKTGEGADTSAKSDGAKDTAKGAKDSSGSTEKTSTGTGDKASTSTPAASAAAS